MGGLSLSGKVRARGSWRSVRCSARVTMLVVLAVGLVLSADQSSPTTPASRLAAAAGAPDTGAVAAAGSVGVAGIAASAPGARPAAQPPGGIVDSAPGFGWTQGKFSVSDDGAAQYNLPLWVPEARVGRVAPQLGLSFDSRAANGLVGVGWSIGGLSSISWCPRTYAQDGFTEGAHFDGTTALCLDGMRLLPTSTAQLPEREYVTERQSFARIVAYGMQDHVPDYFKVWSKDGTIQTFGQTDNARLEAYRLQPGADDEDPLVRAPGGRVTLSWALDKLEDRNGNAATVEYVRGEGDEDELSWVDMRPSTIRYEPNRRVEFGYESRPDPIDSFGGGVQTRTAHRLKTVSMFAGPSGGDAELLREYVLSYQNDSITGRSLLGNIAECHRQPSDGEEVCKASLPLTWTKGSYEFEEFVEEGTEADIPKGFMAGDANGDGADDMIYTLPNDDPEAGDPVRLLVRAGSKNGQLFGFPHESELPFDTVAVRPVDVDVDGKAELLVQYDHREYPGPDRWFRDKWKLFESDGLDYEPVADLDDGRPGLSEGLRLADLDGNGLPDVVGVRHTQNNSPPDNGYYRLNTSSAGSYHFSDVIDADPLGDVAPGGAVGDTDGDGRAEVTTGDGSGWGLNAAGGVEGVSTNARAGNGDVNGDGLEDLVENPWNPEREKNELKLRRNSGRGFDSPSTIPTPDDWPADRAGSEQWASAQMRIVDFNTDGRSDVLVITREGDAWLYQWTGSGFARATEFDVDVAPALGPNNISQWENVQPMDYNGDGLMDLVSSVNVPSSDDRELRIFKHLGGMPDQLVRIGNPVFTPAVDVSYSNLADSAHVPADEGCPYPIVCPFKGGNVVSEHSVASRTVGGDVSWRTFHHAYGGARVDLHGRRPLGFARHVVGSEGSTTITDFDNQTLEVGATSEFAEAEVYPYADVPKTVTYKVRDSDDGREFQRTVSYDNQIRRHEAGSYTVETRSVVTTEEERPVGGSDEWELLRRSRVDSEYDDFGNKLKEVAATDSGRKTITAIEYRNDEGSWLIGLPTQQRVTGCAAGGQDCVTRTSTDEYDEAGNGTVSVVEPDDPDLTLTTETTYGEFGTVESVRSTDDAGNSRTQSYTYDASRLYATSMIDALDHETTVKTHPGLGVVLETTDPNDVTTTMRYDGFGRLVETNEADGSYEHFNNGAFLGFQQIITTTAGGGQTSVLMSPLGQEIERRVRTFDGKTAKVLTEYDERGRVSKRSRPTLADDTPRFTTYTYDNRDRVLSATQPNGAMTRHSYTGLETHTFDPRGTESYAVANVDGDVGSRYEDDPDSPAWLRTRLEYGPFGLATKIVAADGSTQTMRYDTLGRLTEHVDPSRGTSETAYNAFGEPVNQTNGAGEETTLSYDELGRVEQTASPDGTATNTWDTADNGVGYLASARSADGVVTRYTYDELGHQESAAWNVDGEVYRLDYGYDEFGREASLTYPAIPDVGDRLRIDYTYNSSGYLQQIKNPAEPKPYWQGTSRNADGALTEEHFGNDVVSTYGYEPTTGRLTDVATTSPAGQLQSLSVGYDPNGNVAAKADEVSGRAEEFGYDRLNRLLSWTVSAAGGQAHKVGYDYNTIGSLLTEKIDGQPERDVTYRYGEDGAPAHALTSRSGDGDSGSYTYDDAGRQVTGPRRSVDYNGLDLPSSIIWGQPQRTTDYAYDASGARVRKHDDEQTVTYVRGVFERRTSAGTGGSQIHNLHYITADGRVVAQINRVQDAAGGPVTATQQWYLHADNQGSTTVVTNQAGRRVSGGDGILNELFYDPFGRRIDADNIPRGPQRHGGVRLGFTGHGHEDEVGLIDMNGRIYDAQAHGFLTPDPVLQDPLNSQNHNRYSYVWNNPTTYTDPSGFQTTGAGVAGCTPMADWGPMADQSCWAGGATTGVTGSEGIGSFFDNPTFSLTSTAGFDEDSTASTVPGCAGCVGNEDIYVTPVDVTCNDAGTCYGESKGEYWVSYAWNQRRIEYLDRRAYLSGRHVFDGVERLKQDPVRYLTTFGVTDPKQVLGVALMSAIHASDFIGAKGLASLGVKAAVRGVKWAAGKVAARRAARDPLLRFASANRGPGVRFASEYTSPSGARYYDINTSRGPLPEGSPLRATGHHGGCSEVGCLSQALKAEGESAIRGGTMRTIRVRGVDSPIPPGPPSGHGAPASPCAGYCQPLLDFLGIGW